MTSFGLVFPSYIGNLLYTSIATDQNEYSNEKIIYRQVDIVDIYCKDFKDKAIHAIQSFDKSQTSSMIMSCRGVSQTQFSNTTAEGISLDTAAGRKKLSVKDYIGRISIDRPSVAIALADEASWTSPPKRIAKAFDRSLKWFKEFKQSENAMQESRIFGVVVPDYKLQFESMTKELISAGVNGLVLGGACMGENEDILFRAIQVVREIAGNAMPILVQGVRSLKLALKCFMNGASLISSDIPLLLTRNNRAISYPMQRHSGTDRTPMGSYENDQYIQKTETKAMSTKSSNEREESGSNRKRKLSAAVPQDPSDNDREMSKRPRIEGKTKATTVVDEENDAIEPESAKGIYESLDLRATAINENISIDLSDEKYRKDTRPLIEGCKCLSCRSHTRAYIHHLLKVRELLGEILLYSHNQYQLHELSMSLQNLSDDKGKMVASIQSLLSSMAVDAPQSEVLAAKVD